MALVTIVYAVTPDRLGPDTTRMGKVENIDDDLARQMVNDGSGRWPSADELAAYEESRKAEDKAAEDKAAEATADGDLTKLKKDDLLTLAADRGVDANESMTKADIAKAIEDHQPDTVPAEDGTGPVQGPDGGAYGPAPAGALPKTA